MSQLTFTAEIVCISPALSWWPASCQTDGSRHTGSVSLVWVGETHITMAKPDAYADIDFDEIIEATCLANDEIKCLKVTLQIINPPPYPVWPGLLWLVRHQEAGLPLSRRSGRDHESHGLQTHRGGTQGAAGGDWRGRLGRDRVRRVLSTLRYILRKVFLVSSHLTEIGPI